MYELQLYVSRAYGAVASFLCIHNLFMKTDLDVEAIKTAIELEDVDACINFKKEVIAAIPASLANLESFSKVNVEVQMTNPEVGTDVVVLLAPIYIAFKDALVQIDLCVSTWEYYAHVHDSFKQPCEHFSKVFGTVKTLLLPLFKKVEALTMGVHSSLQETKPEFVKQLYTSVMQHQNTILCEYSTKILIHLI